MKRIIKLITGALVLSVISFHMVNAQSNSLKDTDFLKELSAKNKLLSYEMLTTSVGGLEVPLLKLGKFEKGTPSVFLAANMEGIALQETKAALWMVKYLSEQPELLRKANWYILPCGNIDALDNHMTGIEWKSPLNKLPVNDDNDDQTDEDGPDDLNGDGMITTMLVKHPMGEYIKDTADVRYIRKAKKEKGEKGMYKLLIEGIDNDGDGKYNEDGKGGVNINRNFTFDYQPFKPSHGKWNGSEPESFALLKFFAEHKDISMAIILSNSNNMLHPPKSDKASAQKMKVPSYYANQFGLDAKKMYTQEELEKELEGQISSDMFSSLIRRLKNQKPPTTIQSEDIKFYEIISKEFKAFIEKNDCKIDQIKPAKWESGSFEKFCYFQYGLPTFTYNVWQLPAWAEKTKDKTVLTSTQKIIKYADSLNLDLFVKWEKVNHPDFKHVEVGGLKPYALEPSDKELKEMIPTPMKFLAKLPDYLPQLSIAYKVQGKGAGISEVKIFVENIGSLPYPTEIGERTGKPLPVIIGYNGKAKLLSGKERTRLGTIGANSTKEFTFLLQSNSKNTTVEFNLLTENVLTKNATVSVEL